MDIRAFGLILEACLEWRDRDQLRAAEAASMPYMKEEAQRAFVERLSGADKPDSAPAPADPNRRALDAFKELAAMERVRYGGVKVEGNAV